MQESRRHRDLTIMNLGSKSLVFSCDTSSSIGEKIADCLIVPSELTARYCIRVALIELLAINAKPKLTFNLIGNEINPTGKKMLEGIQSELDLAGYPDIMQNGSTEENMPTAMTSVSVVLVGEVENGELLLNKAKAGDLVLQVGKRAVGAEVLEFQHKMIEYKDIKELRELIEVKEIVPVGSKGILYEAKTLAEVNGLAFCLEDRLTEDPELNKSAGPATTILLAVDESIVETLLVKYRDKEARVIGKLI